MYSYSVQNGIASHQSFRQTQSEFNADYPDDAAHWGYWYWSTAATSSMSYQSGQDIVVRQNFLSNGVLPNTQDSNYRAISNMWPVFAFGRFMWRSRRIEDITDILQQMLSAMLEAPQ